MPRMRIGLVAIFEGFFGLLGLYALAQEVIVRWQRGELDLVNLWSHFTYQSTLIAVVALLASTITIWRGVESKSIDLLRGAATLYMIVTGIVYAVLLNDADPAVMFDHHVMHQIIPVFMVVSWFLWHRPSWRIPYATATTWLIYPLVYAVYVLAIYGNVTGDYIYSFLDPANGAELSVLKMIVILTLAAAVVAWVMVHLPLRRVAHRIP